MKSVSSKTSSLVGFLAAFYNKIITETTDDQTENSQIFRFSSNTNFLGLSLVR
jgi:hypothetical protein